MKSCQPVDVNVDQYRYSVYGLNVLSAIEIPELAPASRGTHDVLVSMEDVPESLPNAINGNEWLEFSESGCLLKIPEVGRFLVENGQSIRVDRRVDRHRSRGRGVPTADVRVYLLGSAFGALLHQKRWLPLHVSAVQTNGDVWAFTGHSGAGKSTLVGFLHRQFGWPIVSDDVSVIRPHDRTPLLHPGPRKLKLWHDAVNHLDFHDEQMQQDLTNTEKYQLYLKDQTQHEAGCLRALVVLGQTSNGQRPAIERLRGIDAFQAVSAALYRPAFARFFREPSELMREMADLANQIEVYRFYRHWSLELMAEQLEPVLDRIHTAPRDFGT